MEEKKYYNNYMVATRNFILEVKDEIEKKLRDKGYSIYMPTTYDEPGLGIAIYGNYADSIDDDSNLDSYTCKIDGSDVTVVSCVPYVAKELSDWVDSLPSMETKTNFVEHTMTFKTVEEADKAANVLHNYLAGDEDYVSSAILLNVDKNKVTLVIGDEASKCGKYVAMLGLTYAAYSLMN